MQCIVWFWLLSVSGPVPPFLLCCDLQIVSALHAGQDWHYQECLEKEQREGIEDGLGANCKLWWTPREPALAQEPAPCTLLFEVSVCSWVEAVLHVL